VGGTTASAAVQLIQMRRQARVILLFSSSSIAIYPLNFHALYAAHQQRSECFAALQLSGTM
jgi:hypothetical protein